MCGRDEGTASPPVPGSVVGSEMHCEGHTQGHWLQAPGQHLLLLKVVCEQEPCCAHSGGFLWLGGCSGLWSLQFLFSGDGWLPMCL